MSSETEGAYKAAMDRLVKGAFPSELHHLLPAIRAHVAAVEAERDEARAKLTNTTNTAIDMLTAGCAKHRDITFEELHRVNGCNVCRFHQLDALAARCAEPCAYGHGFPRLDSYDRWSCPECPDCPTFYPGLKVPRFATLGDWNAAQRQARGEQP